MKNLLYFFLFAVIALSSCSASIGDISVSKKEYVKKIIVCDFKAVNYGIINEDEVIEFFSGEADSVLIRYASLKNKKNSGKMFKGERAVEIFKIKKNGKVSYLSNFKRKTFPFSNCRKLKTEPKYFK